MVSAKNLWPSKIIIYSIVIMPRRFRRRRRPYSRSAMPSGYGPTNAITLRAQANRRYRLQRTMRSYIGEVNVHKHKRSWYPSPTLYSVDVADYNVTDGEYQKMGAFQFQLDDLPNVSDFSNLYDSYKLYGVKVQFFPIFNVTSDVPSANTRLSPPMLYTYIDKDDAVVPSIGEFMEFSNGKKRPFTRMLKEYVRPRITREVYRSAIATAYEVAQTPVKLDMAYTNVPHYGLKWALVIPSQQADTNIVWRMKVVLTYYFLTYTPK